MSKKIFWIASYPKSGNTWIRSILCALFFTKDGKFDLEKIDYIPMFEKTDRLEFIKEINSNHYKKLNDFKILSKYWLEIQNNIDPGGDFMFLKTHHSCIKYFNNPFTNSENTRGIIYIVRDPRDIAISYSIYQNKKIEQTIQEMKETLLLTWINKDFINPPTSVLLPWDQHIESWLALDVPKLIIRYEDIISNPTKIIHLIIDFFKKNYGFNFIDINNKIKNMKSTTSFNYLKKIEKNKGFKEKPENLTSFFREGKKNQWKKKLDKNQIIEINKYFELTMKKFKYI